MAGLRFKFSELINELSMLKAIGKNFIETPWELDNLGDTIEQAWSATENRLITLELSALRTRKSRDYEMGDRRGAKKVYAVVTGTWRVRPLGDNSRKPKIRMKRLLEFCDIASTKIELFYEETKTPIGMWRVELGTDYHPGCYFHIQVLGDSDEPPFPKSVSIPRFPSMFVTPMGAIEYVLGELFQDDWHKSVAGDDYHAVQWRKLQLARLLSLLKWYQEELQKDEVISSPWMVLKRAKPDGDMFL